MRNRQKERKGVATTKAKAKREREKERREGKKSIVKAGKASEVSCVETLVVVVLTLWLSTRTCSLN